MTFRAGVACAVLVMSVGWVSQARAGAPAPSGERTLGRTTIEPAYDDMTGKPIYLLTPDGAPFPSVSNPKSWAPLYLIAYPNSAAAAVGTMNCQHQGGDNCPDHGPEIAAAAAQIMPDAYASGVWGHDHLVDAPGGSDFNIAWDVHLVLFTEDLGADTPHVTTEEQMDQLIESGQLVDVGSIVVFNCNVVSAATYNRGTPVTPVP